MAYAHILNLYADQSVLMFKECYALEKIHGTSAHVKFNPAELGNSLQFFSGGASYSVFCELFNKQDLLNKFKGLGFSSVIVYGEAYGGKEQGMGLTYGPNLKFIAFDVEVEGAWVDVPHAESITKELGLEFVDYVRISTELKDLDYQRDRPSVQAERNGMGNNKPREGIVIRPINEMIKAHGIRIIAKHKGDKFSERATPQKIVDPSKLAVLQNAALIADEWVTPNRLKNILSHLKEEEIKVENTKNIILIMIEDVLREAAGEIVDSPETKKAIGKKAAEVFQKYIKDKLK